MENARNQMSFIQEQTPVGDGGTPASPPEHRLFGIDDAIIIPALVGLAGMVFGSLWSNKKADDRAEQANNWSLQQWNRENEYNNPTNQMARLAAAGINPALAYTNGVNNSAATSPSVTSAVGTEKNPLAGIDPETASRIALNNAQADKLQTDADISKQKLPVEIQQMNASIEETNKKIENFQHQWSLMSTEEQLNEAKAVRLSFETVMDSKKYDLAVKDLDSLIDLRRKEGILKREEARKIKADADFLINTMTLRAMGIGLNNSKILSEIGLNDARIRECDANIKLLGLDAILKQYDVEAGYADNWYHVKSNYNLDWNNNSVAGWIRKVFKSSLGITSELLGILPLKLNVRR